MALFSLLLCDRLSTMAHMRGTSNEDKVLLLFIVYHQ